MQHGSTNYYLGISDQYLRISVYRKNVPIAFRKKLLSDVRKWIGTFGEGQ